jgi:hypothetical protein
VIRWALTDFLKHFVALIEDEDLEVREVKVTLLDEGKDTAWSTNNDVRLFESLEKSDVLVDGNTTIDHLCSDVWKLGRETSEFLLDLIGEFSVVAEDKS